MVVTMVVFGSPSSQLRHSSALVVASVGVVGALFGGSSVDEPIWQCLSLHVAADRGGDWGGRGIAGF